MKIGILTLPLQTNYGGILQAYALCTVLKEMGHEVWLINRRYKPISFLRRTLSQFKRYLYIYILKRKPTSSYILKNKELEIISRHTTYFINKYFDHITSEIHDSNQMKQLLNDGFNAFIVGSDQVWRPRYSPCITNYFLDFTENNNSIKRIAYAASFGVSDWEYTSEDTKKCSFFAKKFNAISVREKSGVSLCKRYLNVNAFHLLDPTMLLNISNYKKITTEENESNSAGKLFYYILDETKEKMFLLDLIRKKTSLQPFTVIQDNQVDKENIHKIEKCIFPPVTKWLKGFEDASFIITDSFHGCVFSILFNKPFFVIANKDRGLSRFESLLAIFDLKERLVCVEKKIDIRIIEKKIDWDKVNNKLNQERQKSIHFLQQALIN